MAAGLATLGDDDVDALVHVALGLLHAAAQRRDLHAVLVGEVDDVLGRRAQRVRQQLDRVLERDLDLLAALLVHPTEQALGPVFLGELRHVVLGQELVDPVAVLLRDHLLELLAHPLRVELAGARVLRRHHDVDAVRLAVDVLVDPVQLDLELVGRERQRAEHAEAARLAHRGDDVAAVAEREDRQVDAEHFARTGLHACTSAIVAIFWAHG